MALSTGVNIPVDEVDEEEVAGSVELGVDRPLRDR